MKVTLQKLDSDYLSHSLNIKTVVGQLNWLLASALVSSTWSLANNQQGAVFF